MSTDLPFGVAIAKLSPERNTAQVGTAEQHPLELDRVLLDESRAGKWLAHAWCALTSTPRWRLIRPRTLPLSAAVILIHDLGVDTTRAASSGENVLDLLSEVEPAEPLNVYAVHGRDQALLELAALPDDASWEQMLEAARLADDETVERLMLRCEWRLAGRATALGISGARSAFHQMAAVHGEAMQKLLLRAANFNVLPKRLASANPVRRERLLARRARAALLDVLDTAAVASLRRAGATINGATYNFLATAPQRRPWRVQAITAYPGVLSALIDAPGGSFSGARMSLEAALPAACLPRLTAELCRVIDSGRPLTQWLSEQLSAPADAVRHLRCVPARRLTRPVGHVIASRQTLTPDSVMRAANMLASSSPEGRPASRSRWKRFSRLVDILEPFDHALTLLPPASALRWRQTSLRRFLQLSDRRQDTILAGGHDAALSGLWSAIHGLEHCIESLLAWTVRQGLATEPVAEAIASQRVEDLVRMNTRWHEAIQEFERHGLGLACEQDGSGRVGWPALLSEYRTADRSIIELTDSDRLREEGRIMRHCVGTYASRCLFSACHLFSLRSAEGDRLSTFEVVVDGDPAGKFEPRIAEHRAVLNRVPSSGCMRAAASLLSHLQRKVTAKHYHELDSALQGRLARRAQLEGQLEDARIAYALKQSAPDRILELIAPRRALEQQESRILGATFRTLGV